MEPSGQVAHVFVLGSENVPAGHRKAHIFESMADPRGRAKHWDLAEVPESDSGVWVGHCEHVVDPRMSLYDPH